MEGLLSPMRAKVRGAGSPPVRGAARSRRGREARGLLSRVGAGARAQLRLPADRAGSGRRGGADNGHPRPRLSPGPAHGRPGAPRFGERASRGPLSGGGARGGARPAPHTTGQGTPCGEWVTALCVRHLRGPRDGVRSAGRAWPPARGPEAPWGQQPVSCSHGRPRSPEQGLRGDGLRPESSGGGRGGRPIPAERPSGSSERAGNPALVLRKSPQPPGQMVPMTTRAREPVAGSLRACLATRPRRPSLGKHPLCCSPEAVAALFSENVTAGPVKSRIPDPVPAPCARPCRHHRPGGQPRESLSPAARRPLTCWDGPAVTAGPAPSVGLPGVTAPLGGRCRGNSVSCRGAPADGAVSDGAVSADFSAVRPGFVHLSSQPPRPARPAASEGRSPCK